MKAAISEIEIATTVKPICRAPSSAALTGDMPFSMLRKPFSIITIASSTTKPTEQASAKRERLLIEKPTHHIIAQVPASASGTVTPAAAVAAVRRRNRNTTNITSAIAPSSVICISATLARIIWVRSETTVMSISVLPAWACLVSHAAMASTSNASSLRTGPAAVSRLVARFT